MNRRSFLGFLSALPIIGRLTDSAPVAAVVAPAAASSTAAGAATVGCIIGVALDSIPAGAFGRIALSFSSDNFSDDIATHLATATRPISAGDFLYASDIDHCVRDFKSIHAIKLADFDG